MTYDSLGNIKKILNIAKFYFTLLKSPLNHSRGKPGNDIVAELCPKQNTSWIINNKKVLKAIKKFINNSP
jgi:hypothetical protein